MSRLNLTSYSRLLLRDLVAYFICAALFVLSAFFMTIWLMSLAVGEGSFSWLCAALPCFALGFVWLQYHWTAEEEIRDSRKLMFEHLSEGSEGDDEI